MPDENPTKLPEIIGMTSENPLMGEDIPIGISSAALASLGGK